MKGRTANEGHNDYSTKYSTKITLTHRCGGAYEGRGAIFVGAAHRDDSTFGGRRRGYLAFQSQGIVGLGQRICFRVR